MKSLFTGYFKDLPEEEKEASASTSAEVAAAADGSVLSLQNVRRNVDNAWNTIAYGKWRRKHNVFEEIRLEVWLLGRFYVRTCQGSSYEEDCPLFFNDYSSRIWLTYRRDFSALGNTQKTTDCGWGCMLRSAQMMIAQALTVLHLGRAYRLTEKTNEVLRSIIKLFEDIPDSELGIHKLISIIGDDAVGQWFSPSRAMASLRDVISESTNDFLKDVEVYLTVDNCIFLNEVEELSKGWTKAIILVVCVRLGTKKVNECYINHIRAIFSFECSLGAIGGRPKHSVYFV
uniref:Cysteine protease n=1 Tax=Panagrolaimus sp. JU765 TaxID=591449 RepID=A0AC34PW18_9BILA